MNYPLGLIVVDSYGKIEGEYFLPTWAAAMGWDETKEEEVV